MKLLFAILFSFALIMSCNKPQVDNKDPHAMPPKGQDIPMEKPDPKTEVKVDGRTMKFSNVTMTIPENWVFEPNKSEMRVVQFFLKNDDMVIIPGFYFGNQPDMADANIERWKSEFTKLDKQEKTVLANGKCVFVNLAGTYKKKPFPMAQEFKETANYAMLACIINSNEGPYFFKMVGTTNTLNGEIDGFKAFLNSYKAN